MCIRDRFKEKRIPKPVLSNDIYLGSIPWVIMQIMLVAIVIFVPQSVTMFLDKEIVVDLDKVKIEMPADETKIDPATLLTDGKEDAAKENASSKAAEKQSADDDQRALDALMKK